ncbi:hypothetical protein GCM10007103_26680 [Salinimicrobium marinum]|uniref:PhoD-like phosphatase metallophosphatase domain-containing protein n=1 Tax=Salinimicrobium marinum TaxID=680283 RepID=A0A918SHN6_9FLAO|nr:alkaline phosphatase D family protein [Salinimicrobium marinum]GHA44124.1 hypothetical protein GCM10007103_26680 [Salinimicrobium marinum]
MKLIFKSFLLLLLLNSCTSSKKTGQAEKLVSEISSEDSDFTIAFGSCNRQDLPQPLWDPVLANRPDVFIWGGDNIYADTEDMEELEKEYQLQKQHKAYQKLLASTPVLATWDDHDYGQNDGGSSWEYKAESQQKFLDFFDVSESDVRRSREGVYHSETFTTDEGSVKVILLDTRYFRSELETGKESGKRYEAASGGTILGEAQWDWLETELTISNADFNILVSSIQILSAEHGFETWGNFPTEVERLKDLIVSSKAANVVLLSGDRHISEFSATNLPDLEYPLVDFTSSGLTHTYSDFSGEPNKFRKGEVVSDLSFGLLLFDFSNKRITMQMRGVGNELQQELVETY